MQIPPVPHDARSGDGPRRRVLGLGLGILVVALVLVEPASANGRRGTVSRVVDGDTIEVETRRRSVDVRLLGIDTPETVHPTEPVECFGARGLGVHRAGPRG